MGYMRNIDYITIGDRTKLDREVIISADEKGPVKIGDNVEIGPYTVIVSADHIFSDPQKPIRDQGRVLERVTIGNDVLISSHVTILRGSQIPDGCVIGACSLITRHNKLEPYGVYAGNPLRKIRSRLDSSV